MNLNEYQSLALRTANPGTKKGAPIQLNWILGLIGEVGETAEIIKKHFYHGHPLNYDKLKDELSDIGWYWAVLADSLSFDLEEIAQHNIEKLRSRYPEGFSEERSRNRDE